MLRAGSVLPRRESAVPGRCEMLRGILRRFAGSSSRDTLPAALLAAAVLAGATARAETLIIRSEPPGAHVFLDDEVKSRARTPCALTAVARGAHKIRLTLPGYEDKVRVVFLSAGKPKTVDFQFEETESPAPEPPARTPPPRPQPAPRQKTGFKPRRETDGPPRAVEVTCPLCEGGGLIKRIGCAVCRGVGYVHIRECKKCGTTGRVDYTCPPCKGKGQLAAGDRQGACAKCRGKGHLACGACRGTGSITRPNPEAAGFPTGSCAACDGKGFVPKAKCIVCAGTGQIRIGLTDLGMDLTQAQARRRNWQDNTRMVTCVTCDGKGEGPPVCRRCYGRGFTGSGKRLRPCSSCWGTGRAWVPCRPCGGRGWLRSK